MISGPRVLAAIGSMSRMKLYGSVEYSVALM